MYPKPFKTSNLGILTMLQPKIKDSQIQQYCAFFKPLWHWWFEKSLADLRLFDSRYLGLIVRLQRLLE
jgi:hypothetical protein